MGHRNSMEDSCTIVQDLNIAALNSPHLSPQSFFGVYDGHGGGNASAYLSLNLHVKVAEALTSSAHQLLLIIDEMMTAEVEMNESGLDDSAKSPGRKSDTADGDVYVTAKKEEKDGVSDEKVSESKVAGGDVRRGIQFENEDVVEDEELGGGEGWREVEGSDAPHTVGDEESKGGEDSNVERKESGDSKDVVGVKTEAVREEGGGGDGEQGEKTSADPAEDVGTGVGLADGRLKLAMDTVVIKALKDAFLATDAEFIGTSQFPQNGSTATTALVLGNRLYCANVGDSRTLLCRNFKPVALSQDHKPSRDDEAKRIRDAGGFVINNRVMGELAVSRAFGDAEFKRGIQTVIEEEGLTMCEGADGANKNWDQPLITAEPDVLATTITPNDQFLLLACDGLFDVFTPEEVVTSVRTFLEKHKDVQKCCQHLTKEAIHKRNSRDNVSVILIILHKWF
eukprot:gene462-489_t